MTPTPKSLVTPRTDPRAYLYLVLTTLMWGANTVAGQIAIGQVSPMALTALRWLFVCVILAVVARKDLVADWPALKPKLPSLLLMGVLGFTGFNALFYLAAHFTSAVNVAIIQGAIPVFVFLGAYVAFGTRIGFGQMGGIALAMAGVLFVTVKGDFSIIQTLGFNFGDLLMLIAVILYGGYTVALRNRPKTTDLGFFTIMAMAAFATSLPLVAIEAATGRFQPPTITGWIVTLWIAVFPSLLSQLFFLRGVTMIGPGRAGIFVNLVPIFGAAMAVGILGEPFGWYDSVGLVLVIGGIALAQRR